MEARRFLIGGEWRDPRSDQPTLDVLNPFDGSIVGRVFLATSADLQDAVSVVRRGSAAASGLASFERAEILRRTSDRLRSRREEIAALITAEAGKPVTFARQEVDRGALTFQIAAEEAQRIGGEILPLDLNSASRNRWAVVRRFPVGVILCISPFNFPLNLVAHKVAPAIASGNAFILKPPSQAPLTSLVLAEILLEAGVPPEAFAVVPCGGTTAESLVTDERVNMLTFTGSPAVGWRLKALAGKKRVVLELGGNAGIIIDRSADLSSIVHRNVMGAFGYAGQVCIKVQRIFVHESLFHEYQERFVDAAARIGVGDPRKEDTVVGPVIDDQAADRIESWIREAVQEGASLLTGGGRDGRVIAPTVLTDVADSLRVVSQEVFGPVVTLHRFSTIEEAVEGVNRSSYGLQAGIFSNDFRNILYAYEHLQVGGVIVNDNSTYRIDHMPYGGVKDSGFGREGLRYAIEEMTEPRLLAIHRG